LIQPEKSRRKKASGGGRGSIGGKHDSGALRFQGGASRPLVERTFQRVPTTTSHTVDFLESRFGRVFAQHGATYPFFSPDGQWLGFSSGDGKLKKVPATGGAAITLCDAPSMNDAAWMPDDSIIFRSGVLQGLSRVSAAGGTPANLITPDGKTAIAYAWPHALPRGKVKHG
jgi:WD40-like Beta Propeller Repeat